MSKAPEQENFFKQAWLVLVLAVAYGIALSAVHTGLGPRIAQNKRDATYSVIPQLVEGAARDRTEEHVVQRTDGRDATVYRAISEDGRHVGWVLPADGLGFADRIEILVGVNADASTITGINVLSQKETPGLGDNITREDFRVQFAGTPASAPFKAVKRGPAAPGEIRALSGATVSSDSVCSIVNATLAALGESVRQWEQPPPNTEN